MEENYKIKPLTKSQLIISLDRLTRFKSTEDKYLRVFREILISNLIYPKLKKKQLDLMNYETLTKIVEDIFNTSIDALCTSKDNKNLLEFSTNKKLLEYEKSVFIFDKNVEKLINNKINYNRAIEILVEDSELPLNLKWLKTLHKDPNQIENRFDLGLRFPVEKIVIVEGITEEILLPKFAKILGYDFDKAGINLISAGGKNQVVKLFYKFSEILKLPIFVLLDNDAEENFKEIQHKLRKHDIVHVLKSGEFEDMLPLNLIKRTLNRQFYDSPPIKLEDLRQELPMTKILSEIFRERGLEFKKAEFANLINLSIESKNDVSTEIETVIEELNN